jgi:hypothetical protein
MTTTPIAAPLLDRARHLRDLLTTDGPLAGAAIGTMPLLWTSTGTDGRGPWQDPEAILDEIARSGYEGSQLGTGFPEGEPLRAMLAARELRLAEVYASIAVTVDGPTDEALAECGNGSDCSSPGAARCSASPSTEARTGRERPVTRMTRTRRR